MATLKVRNATNTAWDTISSGFKVRNATNTDWLTPTELKYYDGSQFQTLTIGSITYTGRLYLSKNETSSDSYIYELSPSNLTVINTVNFTTNDIKGICGITNRFYYSELGAKKIHELNKDTLVIINSSKRLGDFTDRGFGGTSDNRLFHMIYNASYDYDFTEYNIDTLVSISTVNKTVSMQLGGYNNKLFHTYSVAYDYPIYVQELNKDTGVYILLWNTSENEIYPSIGGIYDHLYIATNTRKIELNTGNKTKIKEVSHTTSNGYSIGGTK